MEFMRDEEGVICVYVDGACINNGGYGGPPVAGLGVWFGNWHPMNVSERVIGRQTNNTAEIQAARRAIEQARAVGIYDLHIFSDSELTVYGIQEWIKDWRCNGWYTSHGRPVVNKDDYLELDNAVNQMHHVRWSLVPAHSGNRGNEMANLLAQNATK